MIPGFHLSSLDHHDPVVGIERLARRGFGAVAIRPRRGGWDAQARWFDTATEELAAAAKEHHVKVVVDLDAPFYDDPEQEHSHSLASCDSRIRQSARESVERWIERLGGLCPYAITVSSGSLGPGRSPGLGHSAPNQARDPYRVSSAANGSVASTSADSVSSANTESTLENLASILDPLAKSAYESGSMLAIRPVASHAIATVAQFERFEQWLPPETHLGLAADVGEMLLGGEFPIGARLARLKHRLTCIYLCEPDVLRGGDQRFGQGDLDLGRVWSVMSESGFGGPGIFRACGHGLAGLELADQAMVFLKGSGLS